MLNIFKSDYSIKILFSYINNKKKLKIIKYNKRLQNAIEVNLNHFQIFSERYIIYQGNGKGQEYNVYDNNLIYEGEYLNGERNGMGKEFDNFEKLIFEGEYLKGKRWNGEYIKYYDKNTISFQGVYKNGKLNGIGFSPNNYSIYNIKEGKGIIKEYNKEGKIIYEGESLNGERNGKGKEYYSDGKIKFEGEYLNGKRWNGNGFNSNNTISYELKDGKGFVIEDEFNYEGEYLNGERNGKGKEFYSEKKLKFEG